MNQLTASNRSLPLDVFRGMTICFMIIVNNAGSEALAYSPLQHARWQGSLPGCLHGRVVPPSGLAANDRRYKVDPTSNLWGSRGI